jgi:hypothetical protein
MDLDHKKGGIYMRVRLVTFTFILVLAVMLLGAQSCGSSAGTEAVDSVWMGGSYGLTADFEDFGIGNLHEHEVELHIRGVSENDFSSLDFEKTNDEEIDKVSEFLPDGGYERVHFGDAVYEGLTGTFYDANLYLEYTYPYATYIAVPKVCFKEDLRDERVCDVEGSKTAFASASPIQIGTVTERPYGSGKIYLEIPIYNAGQGRSKAYSGDDYSSLYDTVSFEVETSGMECTSRGDPSVARLPVDSGLSSGTTIVCTSDSLEDGALYTSQVDLTLTYYYQDLASTRVRILENPELD